MTMWLRRITISFAAFLLSSVASSAQNKVGMATRIFHPEAHRNWRGAEHQQLHVTVWYPAIDTTIESPQFIGPPDAPIFELGSFSPNAQFAPALRKFPLILLSHGTGGSGAQLAWLATALARAGFVAAAVDHPGNNATEPYTAEGFILWWERATDISEVLDGILKDPEIGPKIDTSRIGAAGFSLGGYTVMELAGAQTDVGPVFDKCRVAPRSPGCFVPEMRQLDPPIHGGDELLARVRKTSGESLARSGDSFQDPRIRAVFAIAPAVSEVLTVESLHSIRIPVNIVVGAADPIAPAADNADYLRANVRGARETVLPGGVAHYTFLDTCTAAAKTTTPVYCGDAPGVDRNAVHAEVAGMVVQFFGKTFKM